VKATRWLQRCRKKATVRDAHRLRETIMGTPVTPNLTHGAGLPSAADLDAVAAEQKLVEQNAIDGQHDLARTRKRPRRRILKSKYRRLHLAQRPIPCRTKRRMDMAFRADPRTLRSTPPSLTTSAT
jgi:hypothetical protein